MKIRTFQIVYTILKIGAYALETEYNDTDLFTV
jgi:hypothetical protein